MNTRRTGNKRLLTHGKRVNVRLTVEKDFQKAKNVNKG